MSKTVELNEDMTSEDIKDYAEAVIEEVRAEREPDRKSDAEIIAGTSSADKSTTENKSSGKAAKEKVQSEEVSGESSSAPEWVTEDLRAEVAAYGIDESDLSEFSSREELDKTLRFLDKKALDAGRKALADSDEPARNEKGQFKKQEAESDKEPVAKNSDRYEVTLSKDLYDDEIVDEFTRLRDHYESRIEKLESHFAHMNAKSEEERFDNYVDSLGYAELFGKTGSESAEELERRTDLLVAVRAQMIGLEKLGRPAEFTDKLVSRVANMVFADEIGKKRLKQQTQKISKQSQMRLGGSPTKPQPPSEDPRAEAERLYRELERS